MSKATSANLKTFSIGPNGGKIVQESALAFHFEGEREFFWQNSLFHLKLWDKLKTIQNVTYFF